MIYRGHTGRVGSGKGLMSQRIEKPGEADKGMGVDFETLLILDFIPVRPGSDF